MNTDRRRENPTEFIRHELQVLKTNAVIFKRPTFALPFIEELTKKEQRDLIESEGFIVNQINANGFILRWE